MYIEKINYNHSHNENLPEQTARWPMFVRVALIVMLFAGLAVSLATAPATDAANAVMVG